MAEQKDAPFRPFSERNYAVPFGRYQPGGEVGSPGNEVLVGREGQRAYLIDLLLRMGRRGAFLVTGHRGVGKTSFVKHCLAVHQDEVFERFLNSNVGRATFWDRIGVMMLGFLLLVVLSMVSQLIEVLSLPLESKQSPSLLLWIFLLPLILVCVYPLLFAREVLREIFEILRENGLMQTRNSNIIGIATVSLFAISICLLPPFGSPALGMSRMLVVVGSLYLWVQGFYFNPAQETTDEHRDSHQEQGTRDQTWSRKWLMSLLFVLLALLFLTGLTLPDQGEGEYLANFGIALTGFGFGNLLRARHLRKAFILDCDQEIPRNRAIPNPGKWYLGSGVFFLIFGILVTLSQSTMEYALASVYLATGGLLVGAWAQKYVMKTEVVEGRTSGPNTSFRPQPLLALGLKAFLCVAVTLQLLHPILVRGFKALSLEIPLYEQIGSWNWLYKDSSLTMLASFLPNSTIGAEAFPSLREEVSWIFALFFCLLAIYYLEYEWIVRPFVRQRSRPAADPAPWEDQIPGWAGGEKGYRGLARVTMPWILYRSWLPILTISVNLGFEKLDHRRVVYSMLAGLREKYHATFLSWGSGFANLTRILGILAVLTLVNVIGQHWFKLPTVDSSQAYELQASHYKHVCSIFQGAQAGPAAANIICKLPGGETLLKILYYNVLESSLSWRSSREHMLFDLMLPYREEAWPLEIPLAPLLDHRSEGSTLWLMLMDKGSLLAERDYTWKPFLTRGIHFYVFHILLFALLYVVGHWLLGRLPIFPHKETIRRIDEVMDFLSARTSVTSRTNRWEPVQVLQGWLTDERVRQIEQEPVDPRTVEFLFLQILNDIQAKSLNLAGARNQLVSLPTPEVTFVFDELDKLGTRVEPGERESGGSAQQAEIQHAERRRSMELHKLLADMKNLLSSAPARFIFVGGRNLHDEWLADQSARQPLLTNIFHAEVYLPSLVTDLGRVEPSNRNLSRNIRIYLETQIRRAKGVYVGSQRKLLLPSLALPIEDASEESFLSRSSISYKFEKDSFDELVCCDDQNLMQASDGEMMKLLYRDFYQFLTYRSMGNPKRLKEILGSFVRPVERAVKNPKMRWGATFRSSDHVLAFGDTERFRIQLLARLYRHLTLAFEHRLVRRDDKLAISVFFLADFLFKFHRRAFSWSNLERVDELVHIHRAPDLREILEAMVIQLSGRFLHPIRNGMYDFRFRSDLAREVEYISRQSHEEMAAFNFTLDESQALKTAYVTNIVQLKDKIGREPIDMVAGLGELHEFDQEYEDARVHYRRCIAVLDKEFEDVAGGYSNEDSSRCCDSTSSPVFEVMAGTANGQQLARVYVTWGIARLRLMLQIGMTSELARNLERAGVEYRSAHTLARALRSAMLSDNSEYQLALDQRDSRGTTKELLHPLKHLNILFQAAFAEAWVAEKVAGAVDTSISLVERELWDLRKALPFVRHFQIQLASSPVHVQGSNFSLIVAELHNKAGDLYFFKGRQKVTFKDLQAMKKSPASQHENRHGLEGYLIRAHYHYAVALHELSRLVTYRRLSSPFKLSASPDQSKSWPTIGKENWPDFIYRSAGGTLNDLAEAMLGRTSLYGVLADLSDTHNQTKDVKDSDKIEESGIGLKRKLTRSFIEWMESARVERGSKCPVVGQEKISLCLGKLTISLRTLDSWLGIWTQRTNDSIVAKTDFSLVEFQNSDHHNDLERLTMSLQLKLVGSKLLEKGGYIEDAAHELLGVCEVVTQYLWWVLAVRRLVDWNESRDESLNLIQPVLVNCTAQEEEFACFLTTIGIYSLKKSDQLFRRGRRAEETDELYLVGNKIPIAELYLGCSLGLAAEAWGLGDKVRDDLSRILQGWGTLGSEQKTDRKTLRDLLRLSLVRHSYPMIGRLHGLKLLIDDLVLEAPDGESKQSTLIDEEGRDVRSWIDELLKLSSDLDAPMHFTPLHSGITCALAYFRSSIPKVGSKLEIGDKEQEKLRRTAQRELQSSEEMFTLRRAYYENISDLYYLYDDFNDRQIHISHGIQMAGAELNALLMYLVTTPDYVSSKNQQRAGTFTKENVISAVESQESTTSG